MMNEDLTKSGNVSVRWQAQMEEHLSIVRDQSKIGGNPMIATANAIAALALATANGLGDIENALSQERVS